MIVERMMSVQHASPYVFMVWINFRRWLGWLANRKSCPLLFHWFSLCFLNFVLRCAVCVRVVFFKIKKNYHKSCMPRCEFRNIKIIHCYLERKSIESRITCSLEIIYCERILVWNFFAPCKMTKSAKIDPFTR